MDSDENDEIFDDNSHLKKRRKKKENQNYLKSCLNKKPLIKYITSFLVLLIILFSFLYIFQFISLFNGTNNIQNEKQKINRINSISSKEQEIEKYVESLRKVDNNEILDFRKINSEKILFDRDKYKRSENPDVSIIVTLNNQAHCIHKAIRSIQNQSLKNIEIIVSIDCSQDNSTETIKQYMKEDERIIIIEHDTKE